MFNKIEEAETKEDLSLRCENWPAGQTVYRAGIPDCFDTGGKKSYGSIVLYDWTTQNHLLQLFSGYKKERMHYLRQNGVKVRKDNIRNSLRDAEWARLAQNFKNSGDGYKQLASRWAKENRDQVKELFIQYVWKRPDRCCSLELKKEILAVKDQKKSVQDFLASSSLVLSGGIEEDLKEYIYSQLPPLIRAAVFRYNQKA